jgi:hypothetical protein
MEINGHLDTTVALPLEIDPWCQLDRRMGLDAMEEREMSRPCQELNPGHLVLSLATLPTELTRLAI